MIYPYRGKWPQIHELAFVAPSADIIGEVCIGKASSIWFQAVIRGDVNTISIGEETNIQDHCVLHVTRQSHPLTIGNQVTVGHRVTLHGCEIGNQVLLGMGTTVLDGAVVQDHCMIGAGSLVTQGMVLPSGYLVYGVPARVIRPLTEKERDFLVQSATHYLQDSVDYRAFLLGPQRWNQDVENQQLDEDMRDLDPEFLEEEVNDDHED